jgi:hypothetical protein
MAFTRWPRTTTLAEIGHQTASFDWYDPGYFLPNSSQTM